jgi:hypothetical protein
MQYGAKVGKVNRNRQEVFTTTVKVDAMGMYTDTNKNQANDFSRISCKTHTPILGLTATKAAHNTMMC